MVCHLGRIRVYRALCRAPGLGRIRWVPSRGRISMGGPTTSEGELRIHQANGSLLVMSGQLTRKGLIQKDIDLCTKLRCIHSFKFMNLRVSCHYSAGVEKRG